MSVNAFVNGLDLYKSDESLKIWRVETPDRKGEFLFTFDCKKVFNFFHDYPEKLTDEEIAIFFIAAVVDENGRGVFRAGEIVFTRNRQ